MKKLTTWLPMLAIMWVTAFLLTSCSWFCGDPCPNPCPRPCPAPRAINVCPEPCPQVCPDTCPEVCSEPECKPAKRCRYSNRNELKCHDFITVKAVNPEMCMLGERYPLEFEVEACDDVCDVVVTTTLPEGVRFVSSDPEAVVEGQKLTWFLGSMHKCERICAKVWVQCECEGELCACFCASALPVRFCSLLCAKPVLECSKCGPKEVCPGDPVNYRITVTNKGSCAAHDVVVTDTIPCNLAHNSGMRSLCYKLGTIEPCETKCIDLCLTACQRGMACNKIVVTSCDADTVSCEWCTMVAICDVEVCKVGPKEQSIGKNSEYQITVTNTGDKCLTEVVVTDCAPSATSIVAANGACINGNQAVWRMRELPPGESATFNITLTTCEVGCFTNRVNVNTCEGCCACTEFMTRWRGRPAMCVQVCDTEDPICIGDPTSYCITVVNQGSEHDDNVRVVVRFPDEVAPVAACGDSTGTISGQTVTFAPVDNFRPRQTLSYRIDARGRKSGDGRVIVEVSSKSIQTPIVQQESTIVH